MADEDGARVPAPRANPDLIGQEYAERELRRLDEVGRLPHAILLSGPRGTGKATLAFRFARFLFSRSAGRSGGILEDSGDGGLAVDPDSTVFRRVASGGHADLLTIERAYDPGRRRLRTEIIVEDAREIARFFQLTAAEEGWRIVIVDGAEEMNRNAANALLKILEEPPPGVVFVFATTEPQKIAAAAAPVLSRLQRFDFRRIGPAAIRDRLRQVLDAERIAADDDALTLIARHADGGMRDALSVLDQCLSFGEGAVTAERVREVLGLVNDELYAEMLALVVERRPEGVFPLVDRLSNAGADLAEFMASVGETLRALLMLQLGNEPEGLTEAMRLALQSYRDRLEPGDVLRMLRLLADSEAAIRRSVNPRLIVETLLLRWTMLDRIVDLAQVLGAGSGGSSGSGGGVRVTPSEAKGPKPNLETRQPGPMAEASSPAPPPAAAAALEPIPATLDALRVSWPEIVAELRGRSRFLGEALAGTTPAAVELPWITVLLSEPNQLFAERLQAQAQVVEEVLRRAIGQPARLRVSEESPAGDSAPPRPRKLTEASLKADRLRTFRSKDPTLDTAADALDLEIVD